MKVRAIGIGDAYSREQTNASILLEAKDYKVLIDCGPTVPFSLWQNDSEWESLDAIYLTHCHCDHALGISMLIDRLVTLKRIKKLTILSHKENHELIQQLINIKFWPKSEPENSFIEIKDVQEKGKLGVFTYKIVSTKHSMPNRGICFEYASKSIFVSGDGIIKEDCFELLKNCDVVIMECQSFDNPPLLGHSNLENCEKVAKVLSNVSCYLYHIQDDCREKMTEKIESIANLKILKENEYFSL
jgi:ribonuclease BN (tRNA processing enzyme)